MDQNKTALERAFELAKSGTVTSVAGLRSQIKGEGYSTAQVDGVSLGRQHRNFINKATDTTRT